MPISCAAPTELALAGLSDGFAARSAMGGHARIT